MSEFTRLFQPGRIGNIETKNRLVMSSMLTCYAHVTGEPSQQMIDYYAERAKGGVGLIVVEGTAFTYPLGVLTASRLRIDSESHVSKHFELVEAVHSYGAKIIVQFLHSGGKGRRIFSEGQQPVSPSGVGRVGLPVPRTLGLEEIAQLNQDVVAAADRCKRAGYDGIELNVGHGYLYHEFLCESTNLRTDQYGGSLQNRTRVITETIRAVKETVGKEFMLMVRMSGEGGYTIEAAEEFALLFEEAGADALDVSGGGIEPYPLLRPGLNPMDLTPGWLVPYAEAVKKAVRVPVITVGEIKEPAFAESILKAGRADFIALGRSLLADPEWPKKAFEGRASEIRKCISCGHCTLSTAGGSKANANRPPLGIPVRCAINPAVGRERKLARLKTGGAKKRVLVIGGGPAGMEAARVAASRGHEVSLYEKDCSLGGQLKLASVPPGKGKIRWVVEFLEGQLNTLKVAVHLNHETDIKEILKQKPDVLIVAAGSKPAIPNVRGVNSNHVFTAQDVLSGKVAVQGHRVIIVGAGQTGCETGEYLAERNCQVTLLDQLSFDRLAPEAIPGLRTPLIARLNTLGVKIHTEQSLKEIESQSLVVTSLTGEERFFPADMVILAAGTIPVREIAEQAAGQVAEIYVVGDSAGYHRIVDAIYWGALTAARI